VIVRRPRRALPGACLVAVVVALAAAAPASAVVTETPGGKWLSYMPLNGQGPANNSPFDASGNLDYNGGPVMPSMQQFAIFWAPTGFSFPPGYEAAIGTYMQNLAVDSGRATNTTSVGAQYTDSTGGRANYSVNVGGSFDDTTAYPVAPASSICTPYTGLVGPAFTTCLTDQALRNEVNAFVTAHSLPRGLSNIYFLFLPDGVGSCFGTGPPSSTNSCFDLDFCAYHTHTVASGTQTIYANESFTPRDPTHCGNGNYPNGHANGNVDDQLSSLSHEANESREDPLTGTNPGWVNTTTGDEGADQCRGTADDYGPLLGGTPGVDGFNQLINGTPYILQQDWSNAHVGCEQRYALSGSTSGPTSGVIGQSLAFNASGSDTDGGTVTSVTVNFGDGSSASGPSASHAYAAPGNYQVTVTVTNSIGLTATTPGPTVSITLPPNRFTFGRVKLNKRNGTAKLPVTVAAPGNLILSGKGIVPIHKAKVSHKAVSAGTTKLRVKAKGKATRTLKKKGKVRVTAKVTFTPTGGTARTQSKRIKLVRKHG
jgi:hypothetical protein